MPTPLDADSTSAVSHALNRARRRSMLHTGMKTVGNAAALLVGQRVRYRHDVGRRHGYELRVTAPCVVLPIISGDTQSSSSAARQ